MINPGNSPCFFGISAPTVKNEPPFNRFSTRDDTAKGGRGFGRGFRSTVCEPPADGPAHECAPFRRPNTMGTLGSGPIDGGPRACREMACAQVAQAVRSAGDVRR